MMPSSSWLLSVGTLIVSSIIAPAQAHSQPAGSYHLSEKWHADTFMEHIEFFTAKDPTNGYVNYVDQKTAEKNGLFKIKSDGSLYMGVDHSSTIDPDGVGRDSVRIESKMFYDHGLYVVDVAHMPGSICGTWPAFWSVGPSWPENGEIDIIEGVNKNNGNEVVLHTSGSCAVSNQDMSGNLTSTECGEASGTIGCVVKGANGTTGTPFNEKGGGVYAMERSTEFIKIWYFPRDSIPESLIRGQPDTASFGTPMAHLQGDCDFAKRFTSQKLVFNTDFCGDWAGGIYGKDGQCPMSDPSDTFKSCKTFVAKNPEEFKEAYWEINSVQIFSPGAGGSGPHSGGPHSHPEPPVTTQVPVSSPIVRPPPTHTESSVSSAETTSAPVKTTQVPETTVEPETTLIPPSTDFPIPAEATTPPATTEIPASTDAPATQAHAQPSESIPTRRSTVYHTFTTTICTEQKANSEAAAIGAQKSTSSAAEETAQPSETATSTPTPNNVPISISSESTSANKDVTPATTSAAPVHESLVTAYSTVPVETTICPGGCSSSTSAPVGADAVAASPTSSVAHTVHIATSLPETSAVAAPSIPASTDEAKPFTPSTTEAAPATSESFSSTPTSSSTEAVSHTAADITSTVFPIPAAKSSHAHSSTSVVGSSSPSMSRMHGASQPPSSSGPSGALFTGAAGRVSVGASTGFVGVVAAVVFLA